MEEAHRFEEEAPPPPPPQGVTRESFKKTDVSARSCPDMSHLEQSVMTVVTGSLKEFVGQTSASTAHLLSFIRVY